MVILQILCLPPFHEIRDFITTHDPGLPPTRFLQSFYMLHIYINTFKFEFHTESNGIYTSVKTFIFTTVYFSTLSITSNR